MNSILGFMGCAALIIYGGSKLSFYGDVIAEKTGLGRSFIGLVLMASVTSLPELMIVVSSVVVMDMPDIAAGDVLGSCVFNLFIIALLDPLSKNQPISSRAGQGHILIGMIGIVLLTMTASSIVFRSIIPSVGHIGVYSFFLILIYLIGLRFVFLYEKKNFSGAMENISHVSYSLKRAVLKYSLNALIVIGAALFLPHFGSDIAEQFGISQSFFGTIFIAASTSLPELVVSIAAVRLGAINLALGNLLGSNLFNIFILGLDDVLYTKGPILGFIANSHLISIFTCIIMTSFICAGIIFKVDKKRFFISIDSVVLIIIYLIGMILLYFHK